MNPFSNKKNFLRNLKNVAESNKTIETIISDNDKIKCPDCKQYETKGNLKESFYVCPKCGKPFNLTAKYRIKITADNRSFKEICGSLKSFNPLGFPGYDEKLTEIREKTNLNDAVTVGTCKIEGRKTVIGVMDNRFLMGSMGMAVGEKITRAFEYATTHKLPVIMFCASGGARMQEGILSLFQMAKTAAAVEKHSEAGLLYISVMTNPTTGGVNASFASLGDIIIAEPKALIGFAGPRVIEQTINEKLPEGFQRAEFLKEHGFLDAIISRAEMRKTLGLLLKMHSKQHHSF